jgi:tetratricopeptide (TPR) repeat protein
LADLQRALQFAPSSNDVLTDVATLYRQRGQHQRCLTTVQHLLDNYASGEEPQYVLFLEGVSLADLGRHQEALESLTRASQGPGNADILYQLARCQSATGQADRATATAQQALAVNAQHQPSQQLLAQLAAIPQTANSTVH